MTMFKTLLLCAGIGLAVVLPQTKAKAEARPLTETEMQTVKGAAAKVCGEWISGCGPNPEPCVVHDPDSDDPSQKYWTSYVLQGYYICTPSLISGRTCSNGNNYVCAQEYKWTISNYEFKCQPNGYAGQKTGGYRYHAGCP